MKRYIIFLLLIFSTSAFAANTLPLPGQSLANEKLQSDTLMTSYAAAGTKVSNCNNYSVINTKVLRQPANGSWKEEWVINACGKNVFVPITFILDSTGATYAISAREIHF